MKNKSLRILSFFIFPALVFLFSIFIGNVLDAYELLPWIDIPMHFLGGISVAYTSILFLNFLKEEKLIKLNSKIAFVIIIVSAVSMIAVLWEFWEFGMDYFFNTHMQLGLGDTMLDLFMGMCGGLFAGLVAMFLQN